APNANSVTQSGQEAAANRTPTSSRPCTNSSARNTTPTWQTSNAETGPERVDEPGVARPSNAVVPKPVERNSPGRLGGSSRESCRPADGWAVGRVDKGCVD